MSARRSTRPSHRGLDPDRGFTLLEVMISLAILGLCLAAIARSQQNSVRAANRAKLMSVATMLARYKMVDIEDTLFDEGFSDFAEEKKGDFKEEGFERFTYTLTVDKVELPQNVDAQSLTSTLGGALGQQTGQEAGSKAPGGGGAMASLGAGLLGKQFEMIRNVLEQSIRRVQLRVEWKEGTRQKEVTVVGYFTDGRKVDAALGGAVLPGGLQSLTGGTQTGATGTGTTGNTLTTPRTTLSPVIR